MGIFSNLLNTADKFATKGLEFGADVLIRGPGKAALTPFAMVSGKDFDSPFGEVKAEPTPGEALGLAAEAAFAGPTGTLGKLAKPVGKVLSPVLKPAGKALGKLARGGAVEDVGRALAPTTKKLKAVTERITPEILERGVKGTRSQVIKQAQEGIQSASTKFDELGKLKGTVKLKPLNDLLDRSKKAFIVDGVTINPRGVAVVDEIQSVLGKFGSSPPAESLRNVRKLWDNEIARAGGFQKTLKEGTELAIKKDAANAIRKQLAKQFPDFAKINKEFSFWKGLEEVALATQARKVGQSGLIRKAAGGAIGALSGGTTGPAGAVIGAAAGEQVSKFLGSGFYRSTSAQFKNKFANLITDGGHSIDRVAGFLDKNKKGLAGLKAKDFIQALTDEAKLTPQEKRTEELARTQRVDSLRQKFEAAVEEAADTDQPGVEEGIEEVASGEEAQRESQEDFTKRVQERLLASQQELQEQAQ